MTIDTLEYVKKLEAAGVEGEVATKRNVDDTAHRLETQLGDRIHRLEVDFEKLTARVQLLTWMVGFNHAATMAVLWKLLR